MPMPCRRRVLATLLASTLVTCACKAASNERAPAGERTAVTGFQTAQDIPAAAPKTDLWAPFLAFATGTYDAQCTSVSAPAAPVPAQYGPLIVAADGTLRAGDIVGKLRPAKAAVLSRSREINGKPQLSMSITTDAVSFGAVHQPDGTKQATFGTVPDIGSKHAMFGIDPGVFECRLAQKLPPAPQSIYARFSGFVNGTGTLTCVHSRTRKASQAAYAMANGVFKIGAKRFNLNTLTKESLTMFSDQRLAYYGNTQEELSFALDLDAQGKPTHLMLWTKGRDLAECGPVP